METLDPGILAQCSLERLCELYAEEREPNLALIRAEFARRRDAGLPAAAEDLAPDEEAPEGQLAKQASVASITACWACFPQWGIQTHFYSLSVFICFLFFCVG
jgi:hypothetical protein